MLKYMDVYDDTKCNNNIKKNLSPLKAFSMLSDCLLTDYKLWSQDS